MLAHAMGHQRQMASEVTEAAQMVVTAAKALDEVVRNGWREVNAAKLARIFHTPCVEMGEGRWR